jgi:F-type H+-transporting ATPase subunit alpha
VIIFAATNGYLDAYPVNECRRYERELYTHLDAHERPLMTQIAEKKDIKGEATERLKQALAEFGQLFQVKA